MKTSPGISAVVLVLAVGMVAVAVPGQGSWPAIVVVAAATALPALGAAAAQRRSAHVGGREGFAWRMLSIALSLTMFVYAADYVGADRLEGVVTLLAYVFGIVALIIVPLPHSSPYERLVSSLDSLGFGAVVATGTFWLVSGSEVADKMFYAISDAAMMAMLVYIAARRSNRVIDWPMLWLVVGLAGTLGGTLVNAISDTPYAMGHPADYAYLVGLGGFALAPLIAPRPRTDTQPMLQPVRWQHILIPYLGAGLLAAAMVTREIIELQTDPLGAFVEIGGVSVMVLVIIRQLVMITEQRRRIAAEQRGVIATVSHELRTPLTSIVGFLDLLEDWEQFTEQEKIDMVTTMRDQSHVLARVVGDLVAVARREIDSLDLVKEPLPASLVIDTARGLVPELESATVSIAVADDLVLTGDAERIVQLIANFLSNAARYGLGRVYVSAFIEAGDAVIEVHDDGPGVPDIYHLVIWERFERADHRQSAIPGSGIGLSVARGIARSHGGETHYRPSERLGGACFVARLPIDSTVLRSGSSPDPTATSVA